MYRVSNLLVFENLPPIAHQGPPTVSTKHHYPSPIILSQVAQKTYIDMSLMHGYGTVEGCVFEFFVKDLKKERKTPADRSAQAAGYKHDIIAFGGRYDTLVWPHAELAYL